MVKDRPSIEDVNKMKTSDPTLELSDSLTPLHLSAMYLMPNAVRTRDMTVPRKSCKAFSSNFLAARKGSAYMKEVWEAGYGRV